VAARRNTVLLVDDSPETLGFLSDSLDQAGFVVLIANDGEAALELLDQVTPDVVLMDALMPGISGFETCRRLKRDKQLPHLPVIFMTGLADTEHVIEGLASGGVDYVTKPIVLEELLARIRVHVSNARIASETRAALDASGRFLVATDRTGRVLWCTPKAQELLSALLPTAAAELSLPPSLLEPLLRQRREGGRTPARSQIVTANRRVDCTLMSTLGPDELLFRLSALSDVGDDCNHLQSSLSLTSREAEVLLWLSRGKSNRDIGEILTISPRTVNKHLQQVFEKLGVENRAAATAQAVRALAR
jgi:DNA-binding response OmpR family regulator/DNA-binding CsgD family transcriptional regulator